MYGTDMISMFKRLVEYSHIIYKVVTVVFDQRSLLDAKYEAQPSQSFPIPDIHHPVLENAKESRIKLIMIQVV